MSDRGSVRYHRGGWEISLHHGGRRIFRRVKGTESRAGRRAAEKALEELATQLGLGAEGLTVAHLLEQYRLVRSAGWSPSTLASHHHHAKAIVAEFGPVEVARLRGADMEAAYGGWLASGVAAGTVRRRHGVLAAALAHAEQWGSVAVSPARGVHLPQTPRRSFDDLPSATAVLDAIERLLHSRLRIAARVAVATGARRGELVGLRWSDVDFDAGSVGFHGAIAVAGDGSMVRKSTKGGRPKVMAVDVETMAALRAWRTIMVEEWLAAGAGHLGSSAPVLGSPSDPRVPWHPGQVTLQWGRHRDGIGLAGLRWHDLRHLHATTLLAAGVPVTTVAARMGHGPRMTLDVYGHAIPALDRAAADVIGRAKPSV